MPGNHDYAVSRLVTALRRDLSSADLTLPDEYRYASLPLCVIDAVYSIGVTYEVTRRTVTRWCEAMPSNLIFISGPSKTADIQQTMAYGAHGPRELVVLLTEDL